MEAGRWWLNPALTLQWAQESLTAFTDDSSPSVAIAPAFVGLLDTFKHPLTADEAVAFFATNYLELVVDEGGDLGEVILSDEQLIASWDLYESKLSDCTSSGRVDVETNLSLDEVLRVHLPFTIQRPGVHNAMAVYFAVELDEDLSLSNSPFTVQAPISWRGQSIRTLPNAEVTTGDVVQVDVVIDLALRPTLSFGRPVPRR